MDRILNAFFDFLKDEVSLEIRLKEFKDDSKLRQEIRGIDKLRSFLNDESANDRLLNLSWNLSLRAINEQDRTYLDDAILLLSIENFEIDYRDSLVGLAVINFACEQLNIELSEVIYRVKEYSTPKAIEYYINFLNRTKVEKSLNVMGLRSIKKENEVFIEQLPPLKMKR
ncbi:MAG: hypothetical protein AAF902_09520 [Chloroflexota bacterium]